MNPRTRTLLDLEATVASLAASVTEIEADKTALKQQLEEAWTAADTARAIAVTLEQQIARIQDEVKEIAHRYADDNDLTREEHAAALGALACCLSAVAAVTDVVGGDAFADELEAA